MLTKLIALFLFTFSVVVSPTYARLGEDEQAVVSRNKENAEKFDEYQADKHFKVYVFNYPKGFYSIGVLDGKVVVETYAVNDEYSFPFEILKQEMATYGTKWDEVESNIENTKRYVTSDGEFFAVVGAMKELGVEKSATFFTKQWKEYGTKEKL